MYIKKCPNCGNDIIYKSEKSLKQSLRKNSVCKICMSKIISEKRKGVVFTEEHKQKLSNKKLGIKLSDEHKKNIGISITGKIRSAKSKIKYSESKKGDKNPAKRKEVKEKIKNTMIKKYLLDPTYKDKISKSLIKYFKNNPSYISYEELEGFQKYKNEVDRLTKRNKKILLKEWNGFDYYDNEFIKNNFNLHYNNSNYPTIDHKIPILYGYKNKFSTELISSIENLCFTKRKLNLKKGINTEELFKLIY